MATKYDAAIIPIGYGSRKDRRNPIAAVAAEFKPLFGLGVRDTIDIRDLLGGTQKFVAPTVKPADHTEEFSHHTMLFAKTHPLAGQDRYVWTDRGDGVQLGVLVDQETGEPIPEVAPLPVNPSETEKV